MGKRCNFTARTVIIYDANLDMREVGVPKHVANTLTVVEHVNRLNYKKIRDMVFTRSAHQIRHPKRWHAWTCKLYEAKSIYPLSALSNES